MDIIKTKRLVLSPISESDARTRLDYADGEARDMLVTMLDGIAADNENKSWYTLYDISCGGGKCGLIGYKSAPVNGIVQVRCSMLPEACGNGYETEALRAINKRAYKTGRCYYVTALSPASDKKLRSCFAAAGFRLVKDEGGTLAWQAENPPTVYLAYFLYAGLILGIAVGFLTKINQFLAIAVLGVIGAFTGAIIDRIGRKKRSEVTSGAHVAQDMVSESLAIKMLQKNSLTDMPMIEAIRRGNSNILATKSGGILLREIVSGVYMFAVSDEAACRSFAQLVSSAGCVLVGSERCADVLMQEFGLEHKTGCITYSYTKQLHLPIDPDIAIQPLDAASLDTVSDCLEGFDAEYLRERLESGNIFGGYVNGELIGFAGILKHGAIGMVNIFPAYRRLGYASSLEAYLVNRDLDAGRAPYCHILRGSEPPEKLQEKLGFQTDYKPVFWLY